jgi:glycosyltransferase involved in cell wall biosynthesis
VADKPKVLVVSHNHPALKPGGAEGYALSLYDALRDSGDFEPLFVGRADENHAGGRPYHLGTPFTAGNNDPGQYLFHTDMANWDWLYGRSAHRSTLTRFYRDFLLAHRPDVVHFQHTLFLGYDIVRVTRNTLPDAPILYMLHDYLPICFRDGQLVRKKHNQLCEEESPRRCHECFPEVSPQTFYMRKRFIQSHLSLVDLFIAPSQYVKDRYVDWGIPAEKIMVEPYACVPVDEPADPGAERKRNRFAFFGQFTPYKGADVLLEAMALLGPEFDGHLWIHGANLEAQSDEFRKRFESQLETTEGTVTFAGPYDHERDLAKLMARTDWVIVPSIWWETGPLVVLEAFQHGRPVICSDIGGMSEKVTDGVDGLHFRRGDAESLADTLRQAAATPGLWKRLHERVPPVYDIGEHAQVIGSAYRRLLQERGRGDAGAAGHIGADTAVAAV